jgi:tetratricopeptide (TPR) repeat protein
VYYQIAKISIELNIHDIQEMKSRIQELESSIDPIIVEKRAFYNAYLQAIESGNKIHKQQSLDNIYNNEIKQNADLSTINIYIEAMNSAVLEVDFVFATENADRALELSTNKYNSITNFEENIQYQLYNIYFDLGYYYNNQNQSNNCLKSYLMAYEAINNLSTSNPDQYEPDVAMTANNLGVFYSDNNKMDEALEMYELALEIRQRLAVKNPDQYEPDVAMTANNLGIFYSDNNKMDEALEMYELAIEIYKRLALKNPDQYEPDVAMTANNLGNFYSDNNKMDEALEMYELALEIRQRLAVKNPDQYEPYVATTTYNLGLFYSDNNKMDEALEMYELALEIYKRLAVKNPDQYEPVLYKVYCNYYNMLSKHDIPKTIELVTSIIKTYKTLSLINPQYQEKVIELQIDLASLYLNSNNTSLAKSAFANAESLLLEITPLMKIQEYIIQAFESIKNKLSE